MERLQVGATSAPCAHLPPRACSSQLSHARFGPPNQPPPTPPAPPGLRVQEEKERLRAQLALASRGGSASEARLAEKEEYIASLQAEGAARTLVQLSAAAGPPSPSRFHMRLRRGQSIAAVHARLPRRREAEPQEWRAGGRLT